MAAVFLERSVGLELETQLRSAAIRSSIEG